MTRPRQSRDQAEDSNRCVIYTRVSTAGQEDNFSLDTQESGARRLAAERGWTVVGVYRDVHSGSELFERPQLTELRHAVRAGQATVVLAHAIDRLSRNQAHLGFLLSEWDHHGVHLELVTEDLANTPEGRLLQSVRGFVAEVERLKIIERTKRGMRARVDSGKPLPGRKPPFGYRWTSDDHSRLAFDPDTMPVARRIFDAVLAGRTLRSIAMELTTEGIATPMGRNSIWVVSSIRSILMHPIYAGKPVAYRTTGQRKRGQRVSQYTPEETWVPLPDDIAPPLLTPDEFAAVKARLEYNRRTAPRNNVDPTGALLRCGIGVCGYCGRPLSVTRRDGRGHMYRCHPVRRDRKGCPGFGVMAEILDQAVWAKVELVLTDPEIIAREVERRANNDQSQDDLAAIDRRLRTVDEQRKRLAKAIASVADDEAVAPLLVELESLAASVKVLRAERQHVEQRAVDEAANQQRLTDLSAWCRRVAGNLPMLTYADKRMVLEALGVSVRMFKADHDPRWVITMAPLPVDPADDGPIVFSKGMPFTTGIRRPIPSRSTD